MPSLPTFERLLHAMGLRLRLSVEAVSTGNVAPADLRRDFLLLDSRTAHRGCDDAFGVLTELAATPTEAGDGAR